MIPNSPTLPFCFNYNVFIDSPPLVELHGESVGFADISGI